MPKKHQFYSQEETTTGHNYDANPFWKKRPLTPANVLVHDVRLETLRPDHGPRLEINERAVQTLIHDSAAYVPSASFVRIAETTDNPIEKQTFTNLEEDYGWIRNLRLQDYQCSTQDSADSAKCRWIHCSSKFPEYLRGFLWALSDDISHVAGSIRLLDSSIQRHTRFSKHGKHFEPFAQTLNSTSHKHNEDAYPMLISVPFIDWSILGPTPPLRFQVDRREGFLSARSSAHILRSVLQYYYRLEDTADREGSQVFAKHKPWSTNRELDLKVRQWYGHYPTALNVDELWILVVDAEHIVTFSSNQTWKARWPPLQLTSRISDVAFRSIRRGFFRSGEGRDYTALTHAVTCLSGAVGMMHRNAWPDIVLCLADRYAGHLGHLQYRLHRSPSTKLVMDLIACQEELNIVIQITEQQIDMIRDLQAMITEYKTADEQDKPSRPVSQRRMYSDLDLYGISSPRQRLPRHQTPNTPLQDPTSLLLDDLDRELADLRDLRDNADRLVTRTIQLVNIRLEDHGKAILVFTVVTIIFLPLNFISSYFGQNFSDIRNMESQQWLFWPIAISITIGVASLSLVLAFSGGAMLERMRVWRDRRREQGLSTATVLRQRADSGERGFRVHRTDTKVF